ncbi:MAG TPA: protein kinase [Actinomycetota bacterium]|nr:protein kinase [Actinomycetota bacterium]
MRSDAETVLGRYRLGETIGAGGMGTVVRGYDEVLGREVAVKLLREELAADERSLTRFRQEARIAASLSHPGIASVYDFADQAGRPAIVMELLDGQDLHTQLAREGPMESHRVAGILAQAADALAYAHGLGAVHRDVKPANIFLTRLGAVKITDFGVAYAASANQLTTTGALIGTPDYLSPEQVRGQRATAASDIYSLGCVAFQMVTGNPPFGGDNSIAAATARLDAPAPSARARNPAVDPDLDAVIARSLAAEPRDRFPSAAAMARALRSAAGVTGNTAPMGLPTETGPLTVPMLVGPPTAVEAPAPVPGGDPASVPAGAPAPAPARATPPWGAVPPPPPTAGPAPVPPRRRHRLAWLWVALLVVFMAGLSLDIVRSWQRMNAPKVIPSWAGMSYDSAGAQARGMGFRVVRSDASSPVAAGQVLATNPAAGGKLKRGKTVTFTVSLGNQAQVPDVSSQSVNDATATLEAKGFHVVVSTQTVPGSVDGQVAAQDPPANAVVAKGATVTLTQTAVPEPTPTPTPSLDNPAQSLLCQLLGAGCPPAPAPTPGHKHGGGNN